MTHNEITIFLGTIQSQVVGESLDKLSGISTSLSLQKGKTLMEEGRPHDCFYPNVVTYEVSDGEKAFYDVAYKKEASSHVMALLVQGAHAGGYFDLGSKEAMVQAALDELDAMFEGAASKHYTGEWRLENWGQTPHIEGTWTTAYRERSRDLKTIRKPLDNRVFFAGEIFDKHRQMGVPGAVLSGFDAAHDALTAE